MKTCDKIQANKTFFLFCISELRLDRSPRQETGVDLHKTLRAISLSNNLTSLIFSDRLKLVYELLAHKKCELMN